MKKITCMLLLLAALSANAQVKQRSTTKGFSAALQVHSLGWTSEYFKFLDEGAPNGFGGGIRLGYGINEMFEPYFAYDFTTINLKDIDAESYKMNHMDLGVRLNFVGNVHPVRPFVEAGYTYLKGTIKRVISGSTYVDAEYYGGKPHLGGGVSFFPSIPISLFAKGIFTVGKKSNLKLNGMVDSDKPDVTTFRITAGIGFNIQELLNK